MRDRKQAIIRSGLEALYFTGAHKLMRPFMGGIGAILTLHRVQPARSDHFQPNRLLEITPDFLETVVQRLQRSGVDLISLDEVHRRLTSGHAGRRFVALTFDDGYRDNKVWAYPVLKSYDVPFAIYVPTSFPEHFGELWWVALERVIADNESIVAIMDGEERRLPCRTTDEKYGAWKTLYPWLRARPDENEIRDFVRELATRNGIDMAAICGELCMTWDEIAELAADPLMTVGAHTIHHIALAKAPEPVMRAELRDSRTELEERFGREVRHLSYPYGDADSAGPREFAAAAELGYKTAVTTQPGVLFPDHRTCLTALPRISLNGEFQRGRYVDVLLSGGATALWNGFLARNARRAAAAAFAPIGGKTARA